MQNSDIQDNSTSMESCDLRFADLSLLILSILASTFLYLLVTSSNTGTETTAELVVIILSQGLAFWGPLVLLSQFKIRGRTRSLGPGELLWIGEALALMGLWMSGLCVLIGLPPQLIGSLALGAIMIFQSVVFGITVVWIIYVILHRFDFKPYTQPEMAGFVFCNSIALGSLLLMALNQNGF